MRRLIVNADDFGLTAGVNRAIIEAHRAGIVTSTTLMANSAAYDEAILLAQQAPRLGVGVHLVFVDGRPIVSPTSIRTLAPGRHSRFRGSIALLAANALLARLNPNEIEREAGAQIRKIQASGVLVSHLDTHKHTHLFPNILKPILRAAARCGISAIRNPLEPTFAQVPASTQWKRRAQVRLLRVLAAGFRELATAAGVSTTDGTLAILATGSLTLEVFRAIIANIPDGTWEFVCHPGYDDDALRATGTRLRASRQRELEILTSDSARRTFEEYGVELISYRDLRPLRS